MTARKLDFSGFFTNAREKVVSLPESLFRDLLPDLDNLLELKLILLCFWQAAEGEDRFPFLTFSQLQAAADYLNLPEAAEEGKTVLQAAIASGVAHQALLSAWADGELIVLLNSPRGRAAWEAIQRGDWSPGEVEPLPLEWSAARPNIFQLYEANIGPLTPMIAETLRDAEDTYPEEWIFEAVQIAVEMNKRSWKYIEAILRRWQEGGRDERKHGRDPQTDYRRYTDGEFSDFIEH